jgi:hypothetical protein
MKFLPDAVTSKVARPLLHLQKSSPKIMFGAGVVGVVGATVLACRATLKVSATLSATEELQYRSELLHEQFKDKSGPGFDEGYDEKEYARNSAILKVKTGLNIAKLYGPSVGLMAISIGLLTGSHVTLSKRNASLTAAYAGVDQAFEKYRQRVVKQLGKDADEEFRYGVDRTEEAVEGKDGKSKTIVHKRVSGNQQHSQYARFFDQFCNDWQKGNPEYNRMFLQCQQNFMNEKLRSRGHLFLNEVYDALGMERSRAGAVVGWVISKTGDNFVDFGIFDDVTNPNVRDFVNGLNDSILLDFNVDGVIYDLI